MDLDEETAPEAGRNAVAPLSLVYYGRHTPEVDARILSARPAYLIANVPHGLWGRVYGADAPWLFHQTPGFADFGIKTAGYITSGYEGTNSGGDIPRELYSLEANRRLIVDMAQIDHAAAVFIDECTAFPDSNSRTYLRQLTHLAHSQGLTAWANTGQDYFDDWYFTDGGFDLVHSTERWAGQRLTPVQQQWSSRVSVSATGYEHGLAEVIRLTMDALDKGLGYCYVTQTYTALPGWLEEYASAVRRRLAMSRQSSWPGAYR